MDIERKIILLQELEESNIILASEGQENIEMIKQKMLTEAHQEKIYRRGDGRVITRITDNGAKKQISGIDNKELNSKLYDFYFGRMNFSMENLFAEWMKWRAEETGVTLKTIQENGYMWNSLLRDTDIVKVPLKNLMPKNFTIYFRHITKDGNLTRKRFNDLKSIMNGIIYYAIEDEIIVHNHIKDINYKQFTFKLEDKSMIPYNEKERNLFVNSLEEDLLSLAIKLDFFLPLRIGELKGLKYADIESEYIYIQRFINEKNQIIDHIKGNRAEGKRCIPLTETAKKIIEQIKEVNPDSEFLFFQNNKPFATSTLNRRLKKQCKILGIKYCSSHGIRFSVASILYKNGMEPTELQKMLGHTTLAMTLHYLRNIIPKEETATKMQEIFG